MRHEEARQRYLLQALNVDQMDDLRRICEQTTTRRAGCPLLLDPWRQSGRKGCDNPIVLIAEGASTELSEQNHI